MFKAGQFILALFLIASFSSCQAIGDIFGAGVWVGIVIVVVIIIVLISVFRKKS